jgi:hypothetical protein
MRVAKLQSLLSLFGLVALVASAGLGCASADADAKPQQSSDEDVVGQPSEGAIAASKAGDSEPSVAEEDPSGDQDLVAYFVERANADDHAAIAERFADSVDWRFFRHASMLGRLKILPPADAEGFVGEYLDKMEHAERAEASRKSWGKAKAGADAAQVRLVIVHAEGLEEQLDHQSGPYVPAMIFGVRQTKAGEEMVFGTVFDELMEDLSRADFSEVLEEGIGVNPEKVRSHE